MAGVGLQRSQRLPAGTALGDNLEIGLRGHQFANAGANQLVVIRNYEA
jgi:hypothetical protein